MSRDPCEGCGRPVKHVGGSEICGACWWRANLGAVGVDA